MLCQFRKDKMLLDLVPEHPIPRYTSYSTAPNFNNNLDKHLGSIGVKS